MHPQLTHVPVGTSGHDVTDLTLMDTLHGFQIAELVMPLQTANDGQLLRLRLFGRLQAQSNAWSIDGDGLLDEAMLACRDRSRKMLRAEVRRSGQNHHIDPGLENLLVGVETRKHVILIDGKTLLSFAERLLQIFGGPLDALRECITHGDQFYVALGLQGLAGSSRTATAAADQSNLQGVITRGIGTGHHQRLRGTCGHRRQRRGLHKIPPRRVRRVLFGILRIKLRHRSISDQADQDGIQEHGTLCCRGNPLHSVPPTSSPPSEP